MSGIYISYRRTESAAYAGRLFDHLSQRFGPSSVFMDIQGGITSGQEFHRAIESALNACNVALVIIGNNWATSTGKDGQRRLDDPNDWVRFETAAVLRRNILVIPVLVDGASLPDPANLPEEVRPLCQRHACELTDSRWSYDVGELVKILEKVGPRPQRFKVPSFKDKRLRWLAGSAIILALMLGLTFIWPTVFHVQNNSLKPQRVTASPIASGTISSAAETQPGGHHPEAVGKGNRINLLASENGGQVLAASSDDWAETINGNERGKNLGMGFGKSGVFGFKDHRPATFDMFTMLIPQASDLNVKDFELLLGNESPTGPFQSIGKFQAYNGRLFETPYQEFKFPPVTAKFLKVTILSNYGYPMTYIFQFQLFGVLQ